MSIIDKIKGDELLDTTLTIKINATEKAKLVSFAEKHKISMGKMVRYGLELVKAEVDKELK